MKHPEPSRIRLHDEELNMVLNALADFRHPTFENKAKQQDYDRRLRAVTRKLERTLAKIR